MVTGQTLLEKLPPFRDEWVTVADDQKVKDIIKQILVAHDRYAGYYDKIALYFDGESIEKICNNLFEFCRKEIAYKEEPEDDQTTALPSGILSRAQGDCKHYAGFIGGCLDGIKRLTGRKINWCYRFASYNLFTQSPHHVFVVVKDKAGEIWIDPVPGANEIEPYWQTDKKINVASMALRDNIGYVFRTESGNYQSGGEPVFRPIDLVDYDIPAPDLPDEDLPENVATAINILLKYGVLDQFGELDQPTVVALSAQLPEVQAIELNNAIDILTTSNVSGFFQDIWRGTKKVSLAVPRGAFLSAVALNIFGMATKLKHATTTQEGSDKVRNKWYWLGGDWKNLRHAIDNGSKRKKILGNVIGVAPAVALPAWVVTATAIIAAVMPLVTSILKQKRAKGDDMSALVAEYGPGNPYGETPTGGGGVLDWVKDNVLLVAGVGFLFVNFVLLPKHKRIIKI